MFEESRKDLSASGKQQQDGTEMDTLTMNRHSLQGLKKQSSSSPNRQASGFNNNQSQSILSQNKLHSNLRDSKLSYEQTRQMLLSRQKLMKGSNAKDQQKYSPTRKVPTNVKKLNNMIYGNAKYLSVPHGIPDHLKKSNQFDKSGLGIGSAVQADRNKIYSVRS
jgi:hypothetical protein